MPLEIRGLTKTWWTSRLMLSIVSCGFYAVIVAVSFINLAAVLTCEVIIVAFLLLSLARLEKLKHLIDISTVMDDQGVVQKKGHTQVFGFDWNEYGGHRKHAASIFEADVDTFDIFDTVGNLLGTLRLFVESNGNPQQRSREMLIRRYLIEQLQLRDREYSPSPRRPTLSLAWSRTILIFGSVLLAAAIGSASYFTREMELGGPNSSSIANTFHQIAPLYLLLLPLFGSMMYAGSQLALHRATRFHTTHVESPTLTEHRLFGNEVTQLEEGVRYRYVASLILRQSRESELRAWVLLSWLALYTSVLIALILPFPAAGSDWVTPSILFCIGVIALLWSKARYRGATAKLDWVNDTIMQSEGKLLVTHADGEHSTFSSPTKRSRSDSKWTYQDGERCYIVYSKYLMRKSPVPI